MTGDNVGGLGTSESKQMCVVLMGPSGSGKSTIGRRLADALAADFIDADDHHSAEAIEIMRSGRGLTDQDRQPWLLRLSALLHAQPRERPVILACSALKAHYRSVLSRGSGHVRFVYLHVTPNELKARLENRSAHYAGASLLESQLAAWEPPAENSNELTVSASGSPEEVTARVLSALSSS